MRVNCGSVVRVSAPAKAGYPGAMLLRLAALASYGSLALMGARRVRRQIGAVSLVSFRLGPADGEPWLLLHGMGSIAGSWAPVIGPMRRGNRLLIPELSGLGGTRAPGGGIAIAHSSEVLAGLLEAELGRSPARPATVVGLSLGGWMAVRLALARPDLVSRLALIDAGGYRHQDWDRIQKLVDLADLEGVDRLYRALFVRTPWVFRHSRPSFLKAYTSRGVRSILRDTTEADTFDDGALARLALPVLLLWGEKDGLFQVEAARAMAAALPQARLEVIPGCGHALHLECPRQLAEALLRFHRAAPATPSPRSARPETA
jgi:pimeloyl-ACP methyl ester carboxylesterase